MHRLHALLGVSLLAAALTGCLQSRRRHVDGGELGRVVIYRNGVAFYERNARVADGRMMVRVPRDKVDDFLKSLTVVDRATGKPLAVTIPRREADDGSYLSMTLETPDLANADVRITYVTEAPAWKPSYRVVVGGAGEVMLEGWAIVDNTTTEDWNKVRVGVGASSALAFRYDLWSVRQVDRDLLAGEEKFAIAPPTGLSPYEEVGGTEELASLGSQELRPGAGAGTIATTVPGTAGDSFGVSLGGSTSAEGQYVVDGLNTSSVGPAGAAKTAGSVTGVVTDQATGEKLPGVTVVVTGPSVAGAETAITDEQGRYHFHRIPPGTYNVTYYYADVTAQRSNVAVATGKSTAVDLKVQQGASGGETIMITGRTPMIDQTSTRTGVTITRNLPGSMGRRFEGDLGGVATEMRRESREVAIKPPSPVKQADDKLKLIAGRVLKDRRDVVVEVYGRPGAEKQLAERGNAVKNKLVNDGVPATRIRIVPKVAPAHADNVRVLAVAPSSPKGAAAAPPSAGARGPISDTPVGESHFMADRPMTVRAGSSAMVAMVHGKTTGGVVYLYDPISERGDARFAFKAVRLENPTNDTLEPGPVTVYGDGRFIGEGITEPVPPKASVVVPFALDKQIVVTREGHEDDRIAKLLTVSRGVITAELQHRRQTRFTVTSRLTTPTTVYLRHRLESGWVLVDPTGLRPAPQAQPVGSPPHDSPRLIETPPPYTKVGDSQLFEVRIGAGETKHVTLAEATPVQRTFDLAAPEALGMMKVYIEEPEASPQLKAQLAALLATHRGAADLADKIDTLREQLAEYRSRSGELHAQLVTLKAVRTSGELMATLRGKLAEMSERMQKTTIEVVETQEKLMLSRVKFQNQLAELKLTDATKPEAGPPAKPEGKPEGKSDVTKR